MNPQGRHPANGAPPLWQLLQGAAAAVQGVMAGRSLTTLLAATDSACRPGVQALAFQALRWFGRAQALCGELVRYPPPAPAHALLCTTLALMWDAERAPYTDFTLVDQAVEAAKRDKAVCAQVPLINACLRRFLRERAALVQRTDKLPHARWNHPSWWITRVQHDHPAHWQAILEAAQAPPPLTLRVNRLRTTVPKYLAALSHAGITAQRCGPDAVRLEKASPVPSLPGFSEGWFSVQDAAAQRAAPLLLDGWPHGRLSGLRVLDACAAPGGKTAHLLEINPSAKVLALDVDAQRCRRIEDNLARLGLTAEIRAADAGTPDTWWSGERFDAILLDAPCSASGIVRRHPDVRWLRREADIAQLAALQARLLQALWPTLRPGGRLLYCTCSIFEQEGEARAQAFLASNTDAVRMPAPGQLLPAIGALASQLDDNETGGNDGFYYALFEKRGV